MSESTGEKPGSQYPSNSQRGREKSVQPEQPKKTVERVTTSDAVIRKKSLGRKIADTFTGDDMHSVVSYVIFDVALPATKTMVSDMVSQGIERLLFGEVRPRGGSKSSYTPYNRYSGGRKHEEARGISPRARANHDFREIVIEQRGEAEDVIDRLSALVDQYQLATVSDLYEMVGITGSFADDKWGWTDLRDARAVRVRDGWLLDLPKTEPIN